MICIENIWFWGVWIKSIFFYNFTDIIKFMALFHLQRLGAEIKSSCFLNLKKIKYRKIIKFSFVQILRFHKIACCFVVLFLEPDGFFFQKALLYRQLNSLQNDLCFKHLGEKLWKKIHFVQPKVNFSKTHQNTMILTMCKIYKINNNKTADICFYYYIDKIIL